MNLESEKFEHAVRVEEERSYIKFEQARLFDKWLHDGIILQPYDSLLINCEIYVDHVYDEFYDIRKIMSVLMLVCLHLKQLGKQKREGRCHRTASTELHAFT